MRFHYFLAPLLFLPFLLVGCGSAQPIADAPEETGIQATTHPDVMVAAPVAGATVTSPLIVAGQARGTWFFEASFPIKLLDDQGVEVGSGIAQAQGEWMTDDFVPFVAAVTFTTNAKTGALMLLKDNPSGEPENDASIMIRVRFGP